MCEPDRKRICAKKTPQPQAEGIELDLVSTWSAPSTKAAFLSVAAVFSLAVSGPERQAFLRSRGDWNDPELSAGLRRCLQHTFGFPREFARCFPRNQPLLADSKTSRRKKEKRKKKNLQGSLRIYVRFILPSRAPHRKGSTYWYLSIT